LAPDDALQHIADRLASSAHALIVAGPAPAQAQAYRTQLASVAALAEAPVIADTASQQRFGRSADGPVVFDHASVVLRSEEGRQALTPDFILQIGRAPISSAWLKFLSERVDTDLMVLAGERFADVESNARLLVQGDIGEALSRLDAMLSARATDARAEDSGWLAHISRLNDAAAAAIERECAVAAPNSEIKAARAIGAALPDGSHLVLGNSLPIRHFDAFIPGDGRDIRVYSQRGVSGIDGLVAGAAGVALDNESPTWIVLGDVSLVHDLGGLGAACALGIRLRVIVLNNAGGRIFDQLPVAARADLAEAMPFFHTTPQVDFEALVSGLGGTYHRAISDRELEERLRKPGADGVEVIEVMLDPSSAKQGLSRITDACLSTESAG
jgi:2-succinyl-5-enolpyruvyl-6-hydroxy-3-cyclohexene-1-carboxylate synthase